MAHHHDTLFNALCDKIGELDPKAVAATEKALWKVPGALSWSSEEERRRNALRSLVSLLRTARRGFEAQVEVTLALPQRLFSELPTYREVFAASPDAAADKVAQLHATMASDLQVVTKIRELRDADQPHVGRRFTRSGWDLVERRLSRRAGHLSADLIAHTWRAGSMTWPQFLENIAQMRTDLIEQFEPARSVPRVAQVIDILEAVRLDELSEDPDDDGDSR